MGKFLSLLLKIKGKPYKKPINFRKRKTTGKNCAILNADQSETEKDYGENYQFYH
jgi:hypothetical protein